MYKYMKHNGECFIKHNRGFTVHFINLFKRGFEKYLSSCSVSYFQTHLSPLSLYFKHLPKINSLTDLVITLNLLYCYGASSLNPRQNFFWLLLDSTWPLSESLAWVKEKHEECRAEPRRRATPRLWNSSLPCWNKPLPWFVSHSRKTGIKSNPFLPKNTQMPS